jgi:hypothetical protein
VANIRKSPPEPLRRALNENTKAFLQSVNAQRARLASAPERERLWHSLRAYIVALSRPRGTDVALPHWLHLLVGVSDDGLRIPGTRVRFGLDALLGTLLPGAGDALGGVTALSLMYVAWRRGAPGDLLFRMLGNATLDVAFGSIPIVGDVFDLGFHANRRNLTLLEDHLRQRTQRARAKRLTAVLAMGLLVVLMLLMLAAAVGLVVFSWRELAQ